MRTAQQEGCRTEGPPTKRLNNAGRRLVEPARFVHASDGRIRFGRCRLKGGNRPQAIR
jgi:hypothetical protein